MILALNFNNLFMKFLNAEPFRIKVVEPIKKSTRKQREEWIKKAHYNVFKLKAEDVYIDMLTDSGTSAMSSNQWSGVMTGDESYAGSKSFFNLKKSIIDIFGFPFVQPTHQGRAADFIMSQLYSKKGNYILGNMHFDSFKGHAEIAGSIPVDLIIKEGEIAILDESFEPYFSKLQIREISTFINEEVPYKNLNKARAFARKKFQSAVIDFNTKEKEIITFAVNQVLETLIKNNISLMYNHPWRFIKVQSWLCGGFAHTRGTYIILSQKYIDRLTKGWNENMSKNFKSDLILKLGSLLVHEQMHSLQRTFKSKFDKLYLDYWNFERGKVNTEKQIELNQVSNPDAPIPEWLIKNEDNLNTFFWVRTLLNKNPKIPIMGKDFHDKVFIVERYNEDFEVKKDLNNNLFSLKLSDIDFYKNSFPVIRGLDHPNEISAYMFSEFFKAIYLDLEPFQNQPLQTKKNTLSFLNWITVEMK